MIPFTQHALERYMTRAKVRDVERAMSELWALPEKVTPLNERVFVHENEVIIVDNDTIVTYYKGTKRQLNHWKCQRNLRLLEKIL
jgi:hypothetical protein